MNIKFMNKTCYPKGYKITTDNSVFNTIDGQAELLEFDQDVLSYKKVLTDSSVYGWLYLDDITQIQHGNGLITKNKQVIKRLLKRAARR